MGRLVLIVVALALAGFTQVPRGVEDPRAFVEQRYAHYLGGRPPPSQHLDEYASERLTALVHSYDEAEGGEDRLGFDWWIDGQDWELSEVRVTQVEDASDRRTVIARFANFGRVSVNRFHFVRAHGRWFLDDVVNTSGGAGWTLSALLRERP